MNCRFTGGIADGAEASIDGAADRWPVIPAPMLWVKSGGKGPYGLRANIRGDGCEYLRVGQSADGYHNYVCPKMLNHDQLIMASESQGDSVY